MRRHHKLLLLFGTGLLLVACGADDDPGAIDDRPVGEVDGEVGGGDDDTSDDTGDDDPADPAERDATAGSDSREATIAAADAAERTGIPADDVEMVRFEMVTWPDGSLGCPRAGESYTMALVEGYRLVVKAGGEELTYHGALGDDPFYCEDPQESAGN